MSVSNNIAPIAAQPTVLTAIEFTSDYSIITVEGKELEPISLGVLLSTIERLCESCGNSMELGKLTSFYSFSAGRSFALQKSAKSNDFKYIIDVSRWSDLGTGFPNYMDEDFPMLPTNEEIIRFLTEESGVLFFGFHNQLTNSWDTYLKAWGDQTQHFQSIGMVAMQIGVLLKSSHYPHGRLCLRFELGSLWIWAGQDGNYCMVFVDTEISQQALGCVIHCGESFILI